MIATVLCAALVVALGTDLPALLAMYLAIGCVTVLATGERPPSGMSWMAWQLCGVGWIVVWPIPVGLEIVERMRGR